MPVFRIITEKSSPINPSFVNVYYVNVSDMSAAITNGQLIANGEEIIHGSTVNFENIHIDRLDSTNFENVPLSAVGSIAASAPMKSNLVARVYWGVPNYYPHYKDYRVHLQGTSLSGIEWGSSMITQLNLFTEYMNDNLFPILCTKNGTLLNSPTSDVEYFFRNTSNKWHNRTTTP